MEGDEVLGLHGWRSRSSSSRRWMGHDFHWRWCEALVVMVVEELGLELGDLVLEVGVALVLGFAVVTNQVVDVF